MTNLQEKTLEELSKIAYRAKRKYISVMQEILRRSKEVEYKQEKCMFGNYNKS